MRGILGYSLPQKEPMSTQSTLIPYDPAKHKDAIHRLWREVGWQQDDGEESIDFRLAAGKGWVAEINGEAEAIGHTSRGILKYKEEDLETSCVTSVATSRIARKQGFATHLTAHCVAQDAMKGALISTLGVFEQGFYNQLGFGTGCYEHLVAFDPAELNVRSPIRPPRRLTLENYEIIHQSRLQRMRGHGALNVLSAEFTRGEMHASKNGFGLGFFDGSGDSLSHHIWFSASHVGRGPYFVRWFAYHLIRMLEPQGIQMQDFVRKPLKGYFVSKKSDYEIGIDSIAFWQLRICDLSACLGRTHLPDTSLAFNLSLLDPIEEHLEDSLAWKGISGEYIIQLGSPSSATPGRDASLPNLQASVGAFTRMWMGIRPASGLSATDRLTAPEELLSRLDDAFCLPSPRLDWDI
jgi:predicted acetyltransferase